MAGLSWTVLPWVLACVMGRNGLGLPASEGSAGVHTRHVSFAWLAVSAGWGLGAASKSTCGLGFSGMVAGFRVGVSRE